MLSAKQAAEKTVNTFDYLNPPVPTSGLRVVDVPLRDATPENIQGYGQVVRGDPKAHRVEIVPWPVQGWRKLDTNTGDEGGTTEGVFQCEWKGMSEIL